MLGKRCGHLTVVARAQSASRHAHWLCLCTCGRQSIVDGCNLRSGHTTSCGCRQGERSIVHGANRRGRRSPEYSVWAGMRARCFNENSPSFKDYGGRGISVCDRWNDFETFLLDMGPRPTKKHTIERRNNNEGYSPDNCMWATKDVQARNRRARKLRTHCVRGHLLDHGNVYVRPSGKRGCRTCRRQSMRAFYERQASGTGKHDATA